MAAAARFERFAHSEYGVSSEELSAACIIDTYSDRFKVCRNGGPLLLPRNIIYCLLQVGAVRHVGALKKYVVRKKDVNWVRIEELKAIRK